MSVSAPAFDIARLKSIKKSIKRTRVVRIKRGDLMNKFRREAYRVLDMNNGNSPRFNKDEWANSFVAQRIKNISAKSSEDKMVREVNRLTNNTDIEKNWQGILMMETAYVLYPGSFSLIDIDLAATNYWRWMGLKS